MIRSIAWRGFWAVYDACGMAADLLDRIREGMVWR